MDSLHSCHGSEKRLFSGKGEGVASRLFLSLAVDKEVQNWVRRDLGGKGDKSERERDTEKKKIGKASVVQRGEGRKYTSFLAVFLRRADGAPPPFSVTFYCMMMKVGGQLTNTKKRERDKKSLMSGRRPWKLLLSFGGGESLDEKFR